MLLTHTASLSGWLMRKRRTRSTISSFSSSSFSASLFLHDVGNAQRNKPTPSFSVLLMWFPNRHEWTTELSRKNGTKTLTKTYNVDGGREGWSILEYIKKKQNKERRTFFFRLGVCVFLVSFVLFPFFHGTIRKIRKRIDWYTTYNWNGNK